MSYTPPPDCSICGNPVSLCQCTENGSKGMGVDIGNMMHQALAKSLHKVPMEDRVLFFAGFMATSLGHMKAAIGAEAAQAVLDALKLLADGDPRAKRRSPSTGALKNNSTKE